MKKKIIFYARKGAEDTHSFLRGLSREARPFGRKILFSFSWYIFVHKPIDLKLEKWLSLRVKVMNLYLRRKNKNKYIFI